MKITIFFVLFILLLGIAYASEGNIDIMKKDIIDKCEEIDEFGNCITQKEIIPVPEQTAKVFSKVGLSIANSFGVSESTDIIIFFIIIGTIAITGVVFATVVFGGG